LKFKFILKIHMDNNLIHRKLSPKKISTCLVLIIFLFIGVSQAMADFEAGLLASQKGDYAKAMREFRSLAEHGHAKAQVQLGILYEMGLGTEKNYPEASKWYQKAAIQGEREAQQKLIEMKQKGRSKNAHPPIPENFEGDVTKAQVQYDIGVMYYNGIGADKDLNTAYRWFNMAANQGHPRAQNDLALMLSKGIGTKSNNSEAYVWFLKAAEQGCADSQLNLGLLLSSGQIKGLPRDFVLAYMWLEIAAQNGIVEARNKQVAISQVMRKDQIETAKIEAREWLSKHSTEK
jgi:TPR repeat protein